VITLKPFQEEGVAFLKSRYHAILADDMGLGKTVQAVRAMDAIGAQKVLIVCPAGTVKLGWYYAILFESRELHHIQDIKTGNDTLDPNASIYIISYDLLSNNHYKFAGMAGDLLICDEAHYMRSITARRTWAVLGDKGKGVASLFKYKWMLTGTLIEHKPHDVYPVLVTLFNKFIQPYGSFDKFVKRFCGGSYYRGEMTPRYATHKDELAAILKPVMLRRKKEDVLEDFPPLVTEIVYFEATAAVKDLIDKEPEYMKENAEGEEYINPQYRGEASKHRLALAMAKIPQAIEYIEGLLEGDDKLVLFAYHHAVVNALAEALHKHNPVILTGGLSDKQKQSAVDLFVKRKEVRIFIGNVEAAGTGVDGLQKVCSTMLFVEFDLRPGKIEQAIDRLHRMLQVNRVLALFAVIENSWESRKLRQILKKIADNEHILGGEQNVIRTSNSEFSRCD